MGWVVNAVRKGGNNDKEDRVAPYTGDSNLIYPDRSWAWYPPKEDDNKGVYGDCLGDRTSQHRTLRITKGL